ncbi:MAG: pyruvate kinase [Endomicrobiaceae bacterium]|jgi:pyruvate kinase|nr:pyruvate kinase [Endomicrobiaceae bacterium]MDD3730247.1 pyruvate kinase [Endomicrobiaceae bacterium]MDD4166245.1 pyruvate kinase [Endomicrobiaceae bacterium]
MAKTGIICTMGPATRSLNVLKKMADSGMTVARLNFSHGSFEQYEKDIALIRTVNKKYNKKIKILGDLEGHRIRIGELKDAKPVALKKGQKLILTTKEMTGNNHTVFIDYSGPISDFKKGLDIYIDDGNLKLTVISVSKENKSIVTEVKMDYLLKQNKGVNIPDAKLHFPEIEEHDMLHIEFAVKNKLDFIANSFVRNKHDMNALKKAVSKRHPKCKLIAKIEDREGLDNITSIIDTCDGIMVARGDLGISIPLWTVPVVQKYIIKKCRSRNKFVITATQMLESMVESPTPTRAEVSDVANAIIDGSNFVMLSAETAIGKFPDKAVQMMGNIINFTEKNIYRL